MVEYLLIAFPHGSGIWAAVLPDFVGVTGRARDLSGAIEQATAGVGLVLKALRAMPAPMPEPSDLAAAQRNFPWGQQYGIDWSKAVVNTVSLPSDNPAFEPARIGTRKDRRRSPGNRRPQPEREHLINHRLRGDALPSAVNDERLATLPDLNAVQVQSPIQ
jgi:predicted RNase H-like HicB family nuclease